MNKLFLIAVAVLMTGALTAQTVEFPDVPVLKGYKGKEGKVTKYNHFNYLTLKDKPGTNSRKSTGEYWEVSYSYDSAFRQKLKFADFMEKQIIEKGGATFFQDTTTIHFAIPEGDGHIWGKVMLTSNSLYRLKIIREQAFDQKVVFDNEQVVKFDDLVAEVKLPSRISFMPNSVITRAEQSKFNHYTFTYTTDDKKTFKQSLMGPYWDFKIEVQDANGDVDKRVSYIEILESYYRAVLKAKGKIIKNRAREIVFTLPAEKYTLWVRVMVTMDGTYFIKAIEQYPEDFKEPRQLYAIPTNDSLPGSVKKDFPQ